MRAVYETGPGPTAADYSRTVDATEHTWPDPAIAAEVRKRLPAPAPEFLREQALARTPLHRQIDRHRVEREALTQLYGGSDDPAL